MTDDECRYMIHWFGGRYPPQFGSPCKDVMRGGIFRILGIVSPSKVFKECLFCATPCEWGGKYIRSRYLHVKDNDLQQEIDVFEHCGAKWWKL